MRRSPSIMPRAVTSPARSITARSPSESALLPAGEGHDAATNADSLACLADHRTGRIVLDTHGGVGGAGGDRDHSGAKRAAAVRGRHRHVGHRLHLPQRRGDSREPPVDPRVARRRRGPDRLRRRRPARRLPPRRRRLRRRTDKKTIVGRPCRLYRNLGGCKFEDVTAKAGLGQARRTASRGSTRHGAAVADYDRDGWPDLLVTGWGRVALFRNVPIDPATRRRPDVRGRHRRGRARQGHHLGDQRRLRRPRRRRLPRPVRLPVRGLVVGEAPAVPLRRQDARRLPAASKFDGLPHKLYRNNGKGTFVDVEPRRPASSPAGRTPARAWACSIVDVDGDGKPDIYVANDTVDNFLYLNQSTPGTIRLRGERPGQRRRPRRPRRRQRQHGAGRRRPRPQRQAVVCG